MEIEASEANNRKAICPRCSGKGFVLCPECKGTGDERNVFFVVTGRCHFCQPNMPNTMKGFVACPKCQGEGTLGAVHLHQAD